MNRRETWEVLEDFHSLFLLCSNFIKDPLERGVIRAIGVSNYEICHLKELFEYATVLPALNQVKDVQNSINAFFRWNIILISIKMIS